MSTRRKVYNLRFSNRRRIPVENKKNLKSNDYVNIYKNVIPDYNADAVKQILENKQKYMKIENALKRKNEKDFITDIENEKKKNKELLYSANETKKKNDVIDLNTIKQRNKKNVSNAII